MTDLLQKAIASVIALPDDQQDELARILLQLTGDGSPLYILTPDEEADLDASLEEAARGDFATDAEIAAMWGRGQR